MIQTGKIQEELSNVDKFFTMRNDYLDGKIIVEKYDIFSQTWASTSLGFDGFGGDAITTAYTYVAECNDGHSYIFFGGRFAYKVKTDELFYKCLRERQMPSVRNSKNCLNVCIL